MDLFLEKYWHEITSSQKYKDFETFNNRTKGESSVNLKLILDSFFGLFKVYKRKKEIISKTN